MTNTRKTFLALLCVGLLAVTAIASTASAKPGDGEDGSGDDRRGPRSGNETDDRKGPRQELRDNRSDDRMDRHERMRAAHDQWQACKREARNESMNASVQERCMEEKAFFLNATHARREARALVGAIAALERRLGRLEEREHLLEDRLAAGNLSANETAAIQQRLDKIEEHQDRMVEKLQDLRARLAALHDRWHAAREHKEHGDDEDDDSDESESESSSSSESSSESQSESQTSTAA